MRDGNHRVSVAKAQGVEMIDAEVVSLQSEIKLKKPDNINVGDIVSYKENDDGMEVLHRVVRMEDDKVYTKGDANNTEDKPVEISQITGIYIGKVEYLGKILSFVTQPLVFSVIITLLLIAQRMRSCLMSKSALDSKIQ